MQDIHYQHKPVPRAVFRAYDIRGIVNEQFDEHAFYSIGKAISCRLHALNRHDIFVARDGRLTSERLASALIQGLLESGIDVFDLGAVPTPVMYFATHTGNVDSGLMVTGSHNPADYNGIKIVLAGKTLANQDIDILYDANQTLQTIEGNGHYQSIDIVADYCHRITQDIQLDRPIKVVVDCGNGIVGPIAPSVLQALGCEVIPLYCEVDGRFPNHHPDPTIESNLVDLKKAVLAHEADLGIAFDGDADRLGVMTNKGELIWPDRLMMLYAKDVLQRNPGATIVFDVKCSKHLSQVIRQLGGIAEMCPTGHSLVKGIMKEKNAALAGEMSGHLFFKDRWYGFDDALYSACRLLEIISRSALTIDAQFDRIPNSVNTPELKIPVSDDYKFTFMQRLLSDVKFDNANVIQIDGLRVEFDHGWGLIRASNTTPCLVARFEADDEDSLHSIQQIFRKQLLAIDQSLQLPF